MKKLEGRVAVVTGAGSGIGKSTSILLAQKGSDVALVDVNEKNLREVESTIKAFGRRASVHVADVSKKERMAALPDEVLKAHGGHVHIVVNNAGVSVTANLDEQRLEDFEWLMGINFWGVVYGCKFFLPHLKREDEAHLVNISSVFGLIGIPTQSSYCASKFAVRGFSESLMAELHGTKVGITCVHPGGINTNIVKSSRTYDEKMKGKAARFFEKRAISPDIAAKEIVDGIQKNKPRVLITRETHIVDGMKRLFPVFSSQLLAASRARFGL
ncbi:MAG: SDR family NAD(P)-dependent oxidoreductase [Bdellovibrionota bacterium]